jgi:hypothetical protein
MTPQEIRDTYANIPHLPSNLKIQAEIAAQIAELIEVLKGYMAQKDSEKVIAKKGAPSA